MITRFLLAATVLSVGAGPGSVRGMEPPSGARRHPHDPDKAKRARIDRFSPAAGHLQVRTTGNGLPGPNRPIHFDGGPFLTQGLAPDGRVVWYYNFDVQPTTPGSEYVLVRDGESRPVEGQLPIVDAIPGTKGYSDFRRQITVTVPVDYVANTAASVDELLAEGYPMMPTSTLVNEPIVPRGSTAWIRNGDESIELQRGWYRGQVIFFFSFQERPLRATGSGTVPVAPIFVTFNVNPDRPKGGPGSGFVTEPDGRQTHNVVTTVPDDAGYSPLWLVNVYDNADFADVTGLPGVGQARVLARGVATVNCPIVYVAPGATRMGQMGTSGEDRSPVREVRHGSWPH